MNQSTRASTSAVRLAVGSVAALVALTRPIIPAPPLSHLEQFGTFLQRNGPVVTAAAGLRIVAILAAGYVLVVAVLAIVVAAGRPSPILGRFVHAVTVPALRFALPGAVGLCLLAAPAGARTAPSGGTAGSAGPTDQRWSTVADERAGIHEPRVVRRSRAVGRRNHPRSRCGRGRLTTTSCSSTRLAPSAPPARPERAKSSSRPDTTVADNDETATSASMNPTLRRPHARTSARARRPPVRRLAATHVSKWNVVTHRVEDRRRTVPDPNSFRHSTCVASDLAGVLTDPRPRRRGAAKSSVRTSRTASTPSRPAAGTKAASARSSTHPGTPVTASSSAARPAVAVTPPSSTAPAHGDGTWTVRPGDHLWHIAHDTVATRLGHAPTDAEVVPYWEQLIDVNRARLVDPDNPDLIFPGQVFTMP